MKMNNWTNGIVTLMAMHAMNAHALNYHELEVYGSQTEAAGVVEVENVTLFSNGVDSQSNILRNTTEFNVGVTDSMNLALYVDAARTDDEPWETKSFRLRNHMSFFEKGEKPIDLGAYFEFSLPRNNDKEEWELEAKLILEKDLGRFTLIANPIIEIESEKEKEDLGDGNFKTEHELETVGAYSLATAYRFDPKIMPKISFYDELRGADERVAVIQPTIDYRFSRLLALGIGAGWGLTKSSEKRLFSTKIEMEF